MVPGSYIALAGLALLVLGAEWLVRGAARLAASAGISPLVIGLTVVAFGTSLPELATSVVAALRRQGFRISLDDFGTGFSSLSRLHELPFDELKIDMSFVRRINTEEGRIMLQTIVHMARAMELAVVAEGVEDLCVAHALRDMGADYLQGFYFSRPKPPEECKLFVEGAQAGGQTPEVSDLCLKPSTPG